jgi:hypothetical protein
MNWMMQSVIDIGTKSQRVKAQTKLDDNLSKSVIVKDVRHQSMISTPATPQGIKNRMNSSIAKAMQ